VKAADIKAIFPSEAALCEAFIGDIRAVGGWTVYPETAGFDILCVYDKTGHQLGIEAKLALNAKVADQILPEPHQYELAGPAPDFRAVLVPAITEANAGIAKLLGIMGVTVVAPRWTWQRGQRGGATRRMPGYENPTFVDFFQSCGWPHRPYDVDAGRPSGWELAWHDWNPAQRCRLPDIVPDVAAGVPGPTMLTQWKIGALRVLAELEVEGSITAKGVREYGIDARRFCATDGWLEAAGGGRWTRGRVPAFDQQHPEAYAKVLAEYRTAKALREAPAA